VQAKLTSSTNGAIPAPGVEKGSSVGATTLLAAKWAVARLCEGEVRSPLIESNTCPALGICR